MKRLPVVPLLICGGILAAPASSQTATTSTRPATAGPSLMPSLGAGTLGNLGMPQSGKARHESSWDRGGGNGDLRPVEPGATITLLDTQGAGVIRRFWCTIAPRATTEIHRMAILRMYWDGESTPSVEVPVGDFFGVGFGQQVDFQSLPLNETSGGYNSYWPMPFHRSARWTLTNYSPRRIDAFYWNIDYTAYDRLPAEMRHFHAQWRRENPTRANENYTLLEARGAGHFVGAAMFMQNRRGRGLGFLEGDEMVYVDGERQPSIYGTGTEDYFSSGWYYDRGPYSALYHGVPIKDTELGRISSYRWHIEDPIPFTQSLRFTIEHGHANDHEADYSSVAYWYQTEPHAPFPRMSTTADALMPYFPPPPPRIPNAIEAEGLIGGARASAGNVSEQDMGTWTGLWSGERQLWWREAQTNATLDLTLNAPAAGTYNLTGHFTKAPDYGRIRVAVNGQSTGDEVNLYNATVVPSGATSLGRVNMNAGANRLTITLTGQDTRASGNLVGIDAFVLTPVTQ